MNGPDDLIDGARDRWHSDARLLLRKAAECIHNGDPMPPAMADYIADALLECSKPGADPRKALQLHGRGRTVNAKHFAIPHMVDALRDDGLTLEVAVAKVAEDEGVAEKTVSHIYEEHPR